MVLTLKRKPYRVCPEYGCSLDRNERCDCETRQEQKPLARSTARTAQNRDAFEHYLDERQREWLYS